MAHAWLKERGVNALLHWRTPLEPDADSPVCPGLLLAPVLEVPPFKGARFKESFFCDMDDAPRMGRTSPLLTGCRIFAPDGEGRIAGRRIPEAKASENRLRTETFLEKYHNPSIENPPRTGKRRNIFVPLSINPTKPSRHLQESTFPKENNIPPETFHIPPFL